MQEYQKRVVQEAEELRIKVEKLDAFIESKAYLTLGLIDRDLMFKQFLAMKEYLYYLNARIERFDK